MVSMLDSSSMMPTLSQVMEKKHSGPVDLAKIGALASSKTMSKADADAVSKDFEAMFIAQMVEQMFGESMGDEAFGSSESEEVYKGLMVQEYGKVITKSGGIGIADYVKRELLNMQEVAS